MQPSSDFEMKKIGFFVKKFSSGFVQQESALREKSFAEKWFLFRKSFYFSATIFGVWVIPLSFLQISLAKCVKPPINVWREKIREINLEEMFSLNNFGLWAEKIWTFSKTLRHDSQNRSLHVQMIIFRNFSGSKTIWMEVFGHWTETSDFPRKCFLRVVKGAFQVFSATLWEKVDKNKLYVLWFRTVCVFFCYERKVSQECQIHKLGLQRKNLGRVFVTQMLFQNVFWFRAEQLAVLVENYPHGCQTYYLWVRRNISRATFLKQVFKHFNFFGVLVKIPWQQSKIIFIVDKIAKSVSMNKLMKNLFQEKKTILTFSSFWAKLFLLLAKNYRIGCQNCNLRIFARFWRKTYIFQKLNVFSNFFGIEMKKIGLLVKKFSSGFVQQESALREKSFEENWFLFRKSFNFLLTFLEFEWSLCPSLVRTLNKIL